MSHSTVCNTTVSTKKTRRTLVKKKRQLHVTPHEWKGNAPVNMKEKYVFVQAIKRGHGYGCVYVCVSSLNKSPVHSYVCVSVCVCVWVCVSVCACNGSAPGSAIKEAHRDVCVCVFVHT